MSSAYMGKCIDHHFPNLVFKLLHSSNYFIVICGVLPQSLLLMDINTMCYLLITLLGPHGYFCLKLNLMLFLYLHNSKLSLKLSFLLKSKSVINHICFYTNHHKTWTRNEQKNRYSNKDYQI